MFSTVLATALNRPWTRAVAVTVLVALIGLAGGQVHHEDTNPLVGTVLLVQRPSAVAVDPQTGHAFVATVGALEPGHVSMVDTATGALLRTVAVGLDPSALAVDGRAGRLVVVNHDSGSVSVLDARSGGIVNTVMVGLLPHAVVVDERTGRAIIAHETGRVSLLDTRRGTLLRAVTVGLSAWGVAVDAGSGHVVVAGTRLDHAGQLRGSVSMLDVTRGRVLRTTAVDLFPRAVTLDERRGRAFVSSPGSNSVSVLDTRHGLLLRTTRVGTNPTAPIVDEQTGRVFVASAAPATVSVLDAGTGRLLRTVAVGPAAGTAPVGLGLRAGPESMLHTVAAGAEPGPLGVAERSGRVFVATRSMTAQADTSMTTGRVSVLDAHSGAVLRTIPVSGDPVAVAVDDRGGRTMIVAGAGVMLLRTWWGPWVQWAHAWQRWLRQQALLALPEVPPQVAADTVPASVTVLDTSRV